MFVVLALVGALTIVGQSTTVLTPHGRRPAECVHVVPDGTHVHHERNHLRFEHPDGTFRRVNKCQNAPNPADMQEGDGWQQYTKMGVNPKEGVIDSFLGKWNVPPVPDESGQTLFTFTGLQNIDWVPPQPRPTQMFDIIQPVLQYGYSAGGGGAYWTIASWYVTLGGDTVVSKLQTVQSGDIIFGNMTRTGPTTWFINSVDDNSNVQSSITVHKPVLKSQPWVYVTLEVYDVDTCAQYPKKGSKITYTNLALSFAGKPTELVWAQGAQGQSPPVCDSSIAVEKDGDVVITF